MSIGDEELLWLTVRTAEAARQVDASIELIMGIAQPWGEYLGTQDRTHSPFVFADTLIRTGLKLAALDLEIIMGLVPRGCYCRDMLDVSRLMDLYALLGLPLQATVGYPSSKEPDANVKAKIEVDAGTWHDGFTPESQAAWARDFARLAICKPFVRAVKWPHLNDAERHLFPNCGLIDGEGNAKPVMEALRELRSQHLT